MSHRTELNQIGFGGALALVVGLGATLYFGMQTQVSRGMLNDTILVVAGETYTSHVKCGASSAVAPTLLEAFAGLHKGERVRIKGYNRNDAQNALAQHFPGCSIGTLNRSKRALWRSMI